MQINFNILDIVPLSIKQIQIKIAACFCLLVHHVSQTGCKLVAYTEFGLRHVNTALVISIVLYAWILVFHPQYDIDSMVRLSIVRYLLCFDRLIWSTVF